MKTHQINNILTKDSFVGPLFLGVFPRDKLMQFGDGALGINTDPSTKPGKHWIAVFVKNNVFMEDTNHSEKFPASFLKSVANMTGATKHDNCDKT